MSPTTKEPPIKVLDTLGQYSISSVNTQYSQENLPSALTEIEMLKSLDFRPLSPSEVTPELLKKAEIILRTPEHLLCDL